MKNSNFPYIVIFVVIVVLTAVLNVQLPSKYKAIADYVKKEGFVNKKCPDNTRSDGPCLMEF